MLRREESNKVLKNVKIILFATSLSLLNPMNVAANEVKQEEITIDNESTTEEKIRAVNTNIKILVGVIGSHTLAGIALGIYTSRKFDKDPSIELIGTKLSDEDSKDNIDAAAKQLKLTNEWEAK